MSNELKPPFEEEFPDSEHPERDETNTEWEIGRINSTEAGYVEDSKNAPEEVAPAATEYDARVRAKTSYPEGGAYAPNPHPKKVSPRIRTAGDANSGDPDLR